jgi:hypothetical protein
MNAPKSVTAQFVWQPNTRHAGTGNVYGLVNAAYAAISDGDTLQLRDISFSEVVDCNRSVAITLKGGYDSGFTSNPGTTAISGSLTITSGTVTLENIVIS